jgi:hypothetical protein
VLNVYGEARIFTDIDLKLVYTSPTGDLTSPIWTEDYVAAQQNVVADKGDGVWIGNNNYTLDIVPTYASIPDGMSLVMMPDTTNVGTLVIQPGHSIPTVFTGTGINDGLFSGKYIGLVPGSIFTVTIDSLGATDTFSWQVDGGAVHSGVPITGAKQSLQDGIFITIAGTVGHTVGDTWTVEVMTPVRVNFCGLGNILVYKSSGGALEVLSKSDIIKGYPAHIDYSLAQNCWILINPSMPVLESLIPLRNRKTISADYVVDTVFDHGAEISAVGTLTITLPECPAAASRFYYFRNSGTGVVTIDAGIYTIKSTEQSTIIVPPYMSVQLATNGVDWHIMTMAEEVPAGVIHIFAGTVVPAGFLLCNGTAVSRTVYSRLFAVIGTAFGIGDDTTTFNLPDLRQRFPLGKAAAGTGATLGDTGGSIDHIHTALLAANNPSFDGGVHTPYILADTGPGLQAGWEIGIDPIAVIGAANPPFQVVNYIIKY